MLGLQVQVVCLEYSLGGSRLLSYFTPRIIVLPAGVEEDCANAFLIFCIVMVQRHS